MLPSVVDLQRDLEKLNKTKAIGEATVGPELYAVAAQEFARLYHPLHFKVALFAAKPVQWRGGMLLYLEKLHSRADANNSETLRSRIHAPSAMGDSSARN